MAAAGANEHLCWKFDPVRERSECDRGARRPAKSAASVLRFPACGRANHCPDHCGGSRATLGLLGLGMDLKHTVSILHLALLRAKYSFIQVHAVACLQRFSPEQFEGPSSIGLSFGAQEEEPAHLVLPKAAGEFI